MCKSMLLIINPKCKKKHQAGRMTKVEVKAMYIIFFTVIFIEDTPFCGSN